MPFLEFTRRELLRELLRARIGPAFTGYQWSRRGVLLERILRERPPEWLPKGYANYDEFIMACADMAVKRLEEEARIAGIANPEQPESWRWGQFTELRMLHPLARSGFLRRHLSVAGVAQNGTGSSVKQTGSTFGPAMRFVADLSNWDHSLMNITLGQSGHYLSPYYRDQFPAWFNGTGIVSPYSAAAQAAVRAHQLRLVPRS
jgi:penicillin amidase